MKKNLKKLVLIGLGSVFILGQSAFASSQDILAPFAKDQLRTLTQEEADLIENLDQRIKEGITTYKNKDNIYVSFDKDGYLDFF